MITYEATTKNHFSKMFFIIIIPTAQRRGECGFRPNTGDIKFTAKRMSERNAGSIQSEMAQKELSSSIKTRQRSQWHETQEGLPQPSDRFPRTLCQECQEGAEQREILLSVSAEM